MSLFRACNFLPLLPIFYLAMMEHNTANAQAAAKPHPLVVGYFLQGGVYGPAPYLVKNLAGADGQPMIDQINYSQGFVTGGHCSVADVTPDLNYAFSAAQSVSGVADTQQQPFRGYFHQLAEFKRLHPGVKVLISLEGRGRDFAWDAQPERRQAFVDSCIDLFVKGHLTPDIVVPDLFDGIDVDWEYPRGAAEGANFVALLQALRQGMDAARPGLLLSIAVGPSPRMYDGVDMAAVGRIVDQVGLMTYDFAGPWSQRTGLIAPLRAGSEFHGGTVEGTVSEFMAAGVPSAKMLMGLPFYGYGWRQVEEANNGLMQEGQSLRGDRPYSYIQGLAAESTVYRDPVSQAPWLFDGDVFWTYEDPPSIEAKGQYAMEQRLGGFMIWELSGDTPSSVLLKTARHALILRTDTAAVRIGAGSN